MLWQALQKHKDHLNQGKQKSFSVLVVSLRILDCHTRKNVRCSLLRHINQNMTHIPEYHLGVLSATSAICVITCIPAEIQPQSCHKMAAQTHIFHLHPCMHSSMHALHFVKTVNMLLLRLLMCHPTAFLFTSYSDVQPSTQSQIIIPALRSISVLRGPWATIHKNSVHSTVSTEKKTHIRVVC